MTSQIPGRAELAVTDGLPPPHDLPRGVFWSTRLSDGSLRIDRADPRVLISCELLGQFEDDPVPEVSFDPGPNCCLSYEGAVVTIRGVNRTVIYRITEFVPRVFGCIAEWPD